MPYNKLLRGFIFLTLLVPLACGHSYTPKPRGYFRIDFPGKNYKRYESNYPYSFEYPEYARVNIFNDDSCWINVDYPDFNAKLHITYHDIFKDPEGYFEDAHTLAYKHTVKAEAIDENVFHNAEKKVYGVLYDIKGNTASSVNFFVTDSVKHFFRGALYFNTNPNKDSLSPVISFLKTDIIRMIESFEWQDPDIH